MTGFTYYGWTVLAVAALAGFLSGPGQTYGIAPFVDPMLTELGLSRGEVAGLYTAGSLTAAALMFAVGRLFDAAGGRAVLAMAGGLLGLAAFWMSAVASPLALYAGFAALRTLGQGTLTLAPTSLIALWFVERRGRAMALYALAPAASQAVFPLLGAWLIAALGWRHAWWALGALVAATLVPAALLFARRSPEAVGLLPDGRASTGHDGGDAPRAAALPEPAFTVRAALDTKAFWLLFLAATAQPLVNTALVFHHMSLITGRGMPLETAAASLSIVAPAVLAGSLMAGFASPRFPIRFCLAAGQGVLLAAMVLAITLDTPWQAMVYGCCMGLATGLLVTGGNLVWPAYFGRTNIGSIRGVTTMGVVAAAALGPLPFGFLFDVTGSYQTALIVFLPLPALCAAAALAATPPRARAAT